MPWHYFLPVLPNDKVSFVSTRSYYKAAAFLKRKAGQCSDPCTNVPDIDEVMCLNVIRTDDSHVSSDHEGFLLLVQNAHALLLAIDFCDCIYSLSLSLVVAVLAQAYL